MKKLADISVRTTWLGVLVTFSLLVIAVGALGLYANHYSRQTFGTLDQIHVEQSGALNRAYIDMLRARVEMDRAAALIEKPSFDRPEPVIEQAKALQQSARQAFEHFQSIPPQPSQADAIDALTERFQSLLNTGLSLQLISLEDNDISGYQSGRSRVSDMSRTFMDSADTFFATSRERGTALSATFNAMSLLLDATIAAAIAISLALVGWVLWWVTRHVTRPLRKLGEHFTRMSNGDLSAPIKARGDNEISRLFHGLATLQRSLAVTVGSVRTSSEAIHERVGHIARGNAELATDTESQAASLEETATSLDELTTSVMHNADNAHQASELATGTAQKAHRGSHMMDEVVDTMRSIENGTQQVGDIISVIDTIAFQTNILALNASVEAARAGTQGRGFAIVANEVRELAGRSASAANQVRALIEDANQRVADGAERVDQAGRSMGAIVAAIQSVSEIVGDIATACSQQSQGINQVNTALSRLEGVTLGNRRRAQQANEIARALETEADELHDGVARFRIATGITSDARSATEASQPCRPPATVERAIACA